MIFDKKKFFKRWAIPGLFFFISGFSIVQLVDKNFADVWI